MSAARRVPVGAVAGLRVTAGEVSARVAARGRVHRVSLILPVLDAAQWDTVAAALGGQPLFRARLLAGRLPVEVVRVFDVLGLALLPRGLDELVVSCSCPEWGEVCDHVSAVLEAVAERVDADPFVLAAWRGMERGALVAAVRGQARAGRAADGGDAVPPVRVAAAPLPADPAAFWAAPALPALPAVAGPPAPGASDGALAPLYARLCRRAGPG
ncbi:hypothetical protein AC529_06540 [Thermobifida cellulosilytica TB100]|uniref:SWIM-type domain-containing protein n=1 Tax=Thermobifida cellulosilytica TB100 TaxID=665004 RepID=A0A147KJP2_THECS|nr:hypothetical protein AC529_06540 [Thermobifida cellulosilytica TB100]